MSPENRIEEISREIMQKVLASTTNKDIARTLLLWAQPKISSLVKWDEAFSDITWYENELQKRFIEEISEEILEIANIQTIDTNILESIIYYVNQQNDNDDQITEETLFKDIFNGKDYDCSNLASILQEYLWLNLNERDAKNDRKLSTLTLKKSISIIRGHIDAPMRLLWLISNIVDTAIIIQNSRLDPIWNIIWLSAEFDVLWRDTYDYQYFVDSLPEIWIYDATLSKDALSLIMLSSHTLWDIVTQIISTMDHSRPPNRKEKIARITKSQGF